MRSDLDSNTIIFPRYPQLLQRLRDLPDARPAAVRAFPESSLPVLPPDGYARRNWPMHLMVAALAVVIGG